jgi:hypothetical protein
MRECALHTHWLRLEVVVYLGYLTPRPPPRHHFQAVRQDVRNLHLEVLQQFHQAQVRGREPLAYVAALLRLTRYLTTATPTSPNQPTCQPTDQPTQNADGPDVCGGGPGPAPGGHPAAAGVTG